MMYKDPKALSHEAIEVLARANDAAALAEALIGVSLADPHVVLATAPLLRHATHPAPGVRGAARRFSISATSVVASARCQIPLPSRLPSRLV